MFFKGVETKKPRTYGAFDIFNGFESLDLAKTYSIDKLAIYKVPTVVSGLSTVDHLSILQVFELFHDLFRNPRKGIPSIMEKILHGHHAS